MESVLQQVHLTRLPPEEREAQFSWKDVSIPAGNEVILQIDWCPTSEGAWRDIVTLEDDQRKRRDVPIVFKAVKPKVMLTVKQYLQ